MTLKLDYKKILYVFYMIFIINVPYSLLYTEYYNEFILAFGVIGGILILATTIKNDYLDITFDRAIKGFIIPMGLITLCSCIGAVWIHHTDNHSDITQSVLRWILYCAAIIIAYVSVKWFRRDAIKLYIISGLISYITVYFRFIYYGGLNALIHPLSGEFNGVKLEVHNLTYCMGLALIFYILDRENYSSKFFEIMTIVLLLGIIIGNKRTLYLGLVFTLFMYFLFSKFENSKLQMMKIVFLMYIIGAFIYLYMIKSGIFSYLIGLLHVNDMSRLKFWNYFSDAYKLSPFYIGRGISYVDLRMAQQETMYQLRITIKTSLHNDLMKAYIGWGFIPFLYYFINIFFLRVKDFVKLGLQKNGWKYFVVVSYTFWLYFFDNMLIANNYNILFFIIWFILIEDREYDENLMEEN